MSILIYILFAGVTALAGAIIFLICHMHYKSKRQRPRDLNNIEEPEVEEHEEDKSTLLGAESQETEEKE